MSEETTTGPNVMPGDLITRPGLYESRGGDIMRIIGWGEGWWVSEWDGKRDWYGSDGRQRFDGGLEPNWWQLLRWVGPLPASEVEPETTTEQLAEIEAQPEPIQVREGRWKTRGGEVRNVTPTPECDGRKERWPWWDARFKQVWRANGRYHCDGKSLPDLVEYLGPIEPEPEAQPQAEPESEPEPQAQPEPIQVREGRWKTRGGGVKDVIPTPEGVPWKGRFPWRDAAYARTWRANGRYHYDGEHSLDLVEYLGPIEPQPEEQPEPQADTVQVREGRWKTRDGEIRNVRPTPECDGREELFPWRDTAYHQTWTSDGRFYSGEESQRDLVEYLGPIEPETEPQPADTADELRSEVSHVQRLLGESRQRVTTLEELVASLRTINAAQEKAVDAAGKENDKNVDTIGRMQRELQQQERELQKRALRIFDLDTINVAQEQAVERANKETEKLALQWAAVKKELTTAAAVCQQLQIELDAAQQVPADSPELRRLRSDLAEVTRDRDEYRHAHGLLLQDANTVHERTQAMTAEAIIEWLYPFRGCNSPALALLLIESLPDIIRNIVGLDTEDVE